MERYRVIGKSSIYLLISKSNGTLRLKEELSHNEIILSENSVVALTIKEEAEWVHKKIKQAYEELEEIQSRCNHEKLITYHITGSEYETYCECCGKGL